MSLDITLVTIANVKFNYYICNLKKRIMKDRLKDLLEKENLTKKEFSALVEIQQSAVSHLLSGRNNPSMDVIQKIVLAFKHINPTWLLVGEGNMYKSLKPVQGSLFDEDTPVKLNTPLSAPQNDAITEEINMEGAVNQSVSLNSNDKKIVRVVIYFDDKTYDEFIH